MLLSFFIGQKKYPIPYDLKGMGTYLALTAVFVGISALIEKTGCNVVLRLAADTVLLIAFLIPVALPLLKNRKKGVRA